MQQYHSPGPDARISHVYAGAPPKNEPDVYCKHDGTVMGITDRSVYENPNTKVSTPLLYKLEISDCQFIQQEVNMLIYDIAGLYVPTEVSLIQLVQLVYCHTTVHHYSQLNHRKRGLILKVIMRI